MVREAPLRRLIVLAATLAWVGPAHTRELCGELTIPSQLGLACAADTEQGSVAVTPTGGAFALLSRMSVRALDRTGADAAAWSDPSAWLRAQVTPDTTALSQSLGGLVEDPDSPLAGDQASSAVEALKRALAGLSALATSACDEPASVGADRWQMRCSYATDGVGLHVLLRLVAAGDRRWADHHAGRQRAADASFRGDRQLVSAVLTVLGAVLVGLHRWDRIAAAKPVEQILIAAALRAEGPQHGLGRPSADGASGARVGAGPTCLSRHAAFPR